MQLTSTESLLLLAELTETLFDLILTKVSSGRVPLMRPLQFPQIFTSIELFSPLIADTVEMSEMCNHENEQNYNVEDVINIIMLYFF